MSRADYTELDAAILHELSASRLTAATICARVVRISEPLATPDRWGDRAGWRVVDRRLQALRKSGAIETRNQRWQLATSKEPTP